jgi:hypothetical protein
VPIRGEDYPTSENKSGEDAASLAGGTPALPLSHSKLSRKNLLVGPSRSVTENIPPTLVGTLVTVVQLTGGAKVDVSFRTKPLGLFVQERVAWRLVMPRFRRGTPVTVTQVENSEVLPAGSVAVAVIE